MYFSLCIIYDIKRVWSQGCRSANRSLKVRFKLNSNGSAAFYTGAQAATRWHSHFIPQTYSLCHIQADAQIHNSLSLYKVCLESSNWPWLKEEKGKREVGKKRARTSRVRQKTKTDGKKEWKTERKEDYCRLTHKQWSNCSHHSWLLGDLCCHGK